MAKATLTLQANLPIKGEEAALQIKFHYTPGTPFRMYKRNGDPADPPDPPEVEYVSAELVVGGALPDAPTTEELDAVAKPWIEEGDGLEQALDLAEELLKGE